MYLSFNLPSDKEHYAVFGDPISHSWSPQIHTLFAEQSKQLIDYHAYCVPKAKLASALNEFFRAGGKGVNITLPLKHIAFELVDTLTDNAKMAQAVNTLSYDKNKRKWLGDNTDGIGLLRDFKLHQKRNIENQSILLLGAGGAAWGIIGPLLSAKPKSLVVYNRTLERAQSLVKAFQKAGNVTYCEQLEANMVGFDVIINATSTGLQKKKISLPDSILHTKSFCYDLIYGKGDTPFLLWAKEHQITNVADGLGMLVEQAAAAFQIWRGICPDTKPVLETIRTQLKNLSSL